MMRSQEKRASCEMVAGCPHPVTHIGVKGYIYCAEHAVQRSSAGYERCRKLRPWELQWIRSGKTLPSYKPGPKPAGNTASAHVSTGHTAE